MSLVNYTFFKKRPKCGELELSPLTAGRLVILEEKENPLAGADGGGDDPDPFALYEALLVCSSDAETLAELSVLTENDWILEVRKFGFDVSDEALNRFQEIMQEEMDTIQKSLVKPAKKKARSARKHGKKKR